MYIYILLRRNVYIFFPKLSAEVACRLAAVIKDDGGGGASQMPSWSQIRLEVE